MTITCISNFYSYGYITSRCSDNLYKTKHHLIDYFDELMFLMWFKNYKYIMTI